MSKRWTVIGGVAACAACCAPLLLPALTAASAAVGPAGAAVWAGLPADAVVCGSIALALLVTYGVWTYRHRRSARTAARACNCDTMCAVQAEPPV